MLFLIVMNQNVKRSVIALLERAGSVAQAGSQAAPEEMMALNQECGGIIPGWYIELVSWAIPESAKHNDGMHPTPHHGASHASCVGARVMPGG